MNIASFSKVFSTLDFVFLSVVFLILINKFISNEKGSKRYNKGRGRVRASRQEKRESSPERLLNTRKTPF